jgi:hypothetical protein
VVKDAFFEQSRSTACATSSGAPKRAIGCIASALA